MNPALRPVRTSDLESIHRIHRAAETHDHLPLSTPFSEFQDWLSEPHFDLAADARLAEAGGVPLGWGRIWHQPSGVHEERVYLIGSVDPAHRGRGIGTALLTWQIARAEEVLRRASPALPRHVRAQAYDFHESVIRLYTRHGMAPVRYTDELLRELETPPSPATVEGISIVSWERAGSDQIRVAQNEAFADHWGSTPRDRATWEHDLVGTGIRLDLSFVALDGDRVVGSCRNACFPDDEALHGRREGWIFQLSVVRSHRRRGIAAALIAASLADFQSAGLTHAALAVDSENPTGAYRLYERLGFRPLRRSVVYQREAQG